MSYEAIPFHEFGGLDLRAAPDEVGGGALEAYNVDLSRPGLVRQRDGTDDFSATATADTTVRLIPYYRTGATRRLVGADAAGTITVYTTSGVTEATQTGWSAIADMARFGSPSAERVYITRGAAGSTIGRLDTTTFSTPAGMPSADHLAVQPLDNRLVAGFIYSGGTEYRSRVQFSNAGDAETWGADDYVDLAPGDGEGITALASWSGQLFAFKRNRFAVFYGNSTDSTGAPVFNYRWVETGVGAKSWWAACSGDDGVYFVDADGVYVTDGGPPVLVSGELDPYFRGETLPFFGGTAISRTEFTTEGLTRTQLTYFDRKLYVTVPISSGSNALLVYDTEQKKWSYWSLDVYGLCPFSVGQQEQLYFGRIGAAPHHVFRQSSAYADDNGTAITARHRSGFNDLGIEEEKTIRETLLWGTGTVAVSMARDFGSLDSATNVTLGTSPAVAGGRRRVAKRGTVFSHQLASVSGGAWAVHRLTQHVRESRSTGIKTAA